MTRFSFYLVLVLLGTAFVTQAQQAESLILEGKTLLRQGQNGNDQDALMQARAVFTRVTQAPDHAAKAHYYLARIEEHLMNLSRDDEDVVLDHLDRALEHLEAATEADEDFADAVALHGSLVGQKAGLQPIKAMFLGPKSDRLMAKAEELAPDNPRVVLLQAISQYYKPSMFGGDKEAALGGFEAAAALAEAEALADPTLPSWGHAEAYAWIGLAHMDAGRLAEARTALDQALVIDPGYGWVKYVLMPQLASQ